MTDLEKQWLQEGSHHMHGWDFSHLEGRWETTPLPWDYSTQVRERLRPEDEWLDLDTGGGELMCQFNHAADKTTVTENWQPNVELLKQSVVPSGVHLYPMADVQLSQLADQTYDVITSSHGRVPTAGIARTLKPGGYFVTQQVGATNNYTLARFLNPHYVPAYPENTLIAITTALQAAGLEIVMADAAYAKMNFDDVGAVVYYATMIPWEFPDFDAEQQLPKLHQLQQLIVATGKITTFEDRFMVVARKPG
ncbi:class I SAM-dependent methyltransferase [Lactiplantibacillus carotarum]|uniref:class I SAM-dependent methyltransferase n=1 Tax=Lactiplantibacillus carotarum TaxID=2993456 RepID=UPI00298EDD19|nr:SAM-dependent methyltransferase [Lactiplantibacillus carotarum]